MNTKDTRELVRALRERLCDGDDSGMDDFYVRLLAETRTADNGLKTLDTAWALYVDRRKSLTERQREVRKAELDFEAARGLLADVLCVAQERLIPIKVREEQQMDEVREARRRGG